MLPPPPIRTSHCLNFGANPHKGFVTFTFGYLGYLCLSYFYLFSFYLWVWVSHGVFNNQIAFGVSFALRLD